ncbi:MAG: lipase maturation factor family protein [Candidatus Sulfotelmatobacter sp.]
MLLYRDWELGIILTANYTFLNYLVLTLGFLLLDDRFLLRFFPQRRKKSIVADATLKQSEMQSSGSILPRFRIARLSVISFLLGWIFYATTAELIWMFSALPLPAAPLAALEPFRIANRYGLFGIMTRGRYEIEFQGSEDGKTWVAYPFRYKPQDLSRPPGIYAPYQPRLDWNLWFASLGSWQDYQIVPRTRSLLTLQ